MALYSKAMDLGLAMPTPTHALTEAAEQAREAHRRHGHEVRLSRQVARLVTDHDNPAQLPWRGPKVNGTARRIARLAEAQGFEVIIREHPTGCVVEGLDLSRKLGFRAYWQSGKATGATWHSGGRDTYRMVRDDRPVGVNKLTRTALTGKRGAGLAPVHLKLVASPRGIPMTVTDLERMLDHDR